MSNKSKIDNTINYNNWFDSKYYHILYENRDNIEAKNFIEYIITYLNFEKGKKVLDAACGKGRHSIEIEKLGYKVLGIDLSKNSIQIAKKNENKNLKFKLHDISKPLGEKFDIVFNLFTSFGYYEKKKDIEILQTIEKNMQVDGLAVIDFFNIEKVKNKLVKNEVIVKNNLKFIIKREITKNFVLKKILVKDGEMKYEFTEKVNALSYNDFKKYLIQTSLKIIKVFGDYKLNPFNKKKSPRLILILKKIPAKKNDWDSKKAVTYSPTNW